MATDLISFLDSQGVQWMPINLEFRQAEKGKFKGQQKKYLRPYSQDGSMPSYNDLCDITLVTKRKAWIESYNHIWIDTNNLNQIDVDGDVDPQLRTPYFRSVGKKKPHYFVLGFHGFAKKRSNTIWQDVELLCGQGSYAEKHAVVENADIPVLNFSGKVDDVLESDERVKRRINSSINPNLSQSLNEIFGTAGEWKSNYYSGSRGIVLIPSTDKTCLIHRNKTHSCVQSFVMVSKTSATARCHACGDCRIDIKKNLEKWKQIRQHFELCGDENDKISFDDIQEYLDEYCAEEDIMKKDGYMMRRSPECRVEYERIAKFGPFLDDLFREAEVPLKKLYKKPGSKRNLEDYLQNIDTDIRTLKRDSNIIAFKNGLLKLSDLSFSDYNEEKNYEFTAKKYIPLHFHVEWLSMKWDEIECPIFDKIIKDQPEISSDPMVLLAFYGLLGSLHYPVGRDCIKVAPYLVGTSGTGKSTVVNIIMSTFSPEIVGTINYKEKTFGKSAFLDHDVIIDSDTPANMIDSFGKTDFQKAVSGETIAIPIKNQKQEEQHKVTQRMLFCSQYMQDVQDTGEVIRRIAYFGFQPVEHTRSDLEYECISAELHRVLIKILLARKHLIQTFNNKPFHEWGIMYFESRKDDILYENNYIYRFISEHKQVKIRKGDRIPFEVFVRIFNDHFKAQPNRPKRPKTTDVMFTKMGLNVIKEDFCKNCDKPFMLNHSCCDHYAHNNKTTRYFVGNLHYEEPYDLLVDIAD